MPDPTPYSKSQVSNQKRKVERVRPNSVDDGHQIIQNGGTQPSQRTPESFLVWIQPFQSKGMIRNWYGTEGHMSHERSLERSFGIPHTTPGEHVESERRTSSLKCHEVGKGESSLDERAVSLNPLTHLHHCFPTIAKAGVWYEGHPWRYSCVALSFPHEEASHHRAGMRIPLKYKSSRELQKQGVVKTYCEVVN